MSKVILTILLSALSLFAAEVTGAWTGTLQTPNDDGSDRSDSAYLVLKQDGNTVTGSAGGNVDDQHPIRNGKIQGDQITFEVVNRNNMTMKVSLKLDGDTLKGQIQRERDGATQTAKLDLKRNK